MALIKCEDCGKEISDKIHACIHCGCPVEKNRSRETTNNDKKYCIRCGKEIIGDNVICDECMMGKNIQYKTWNQLSNMDKRRYSDYRTKVLKIKADTFKMIVKNILLVLGCGLLVLFPIGTIFGVILITLAVFIYYLELEDQRYYYELHVKELYEKEIIK